MKLTKRQVGKDNQKKGAAFEDVLPRLLKPHGIINVERHYTDKICVGGRTKYVGKTPGDFSAIGVVSGFPFAPYVLIEAKNTLKKNLPYSELTSNEHESLLRHAKSGGFSLIAWFGGDKVRYWSYTPTGIHSFKKGNSLKRDCPLQLGENWHINDWAYERLSLME